jgi:hypothetical protein
MTINKELIRNEKANLATGSGGLLASGGVNTIGDLAPSAL